jgi:hypothetical protein
MDSPQKNFKLVADGYRCSHYEHIMDLEILRRGAKDECPACRLWLACIDWAVPRLFEYDQVDKVWVDRCTVTVVVARLGMIDLMAFLIDGMSARELLCVKTNSLSYLKS